jgi:putative peptidoglycan lipid II flippase
MSLIRAFATVSGLTMVSRVFGFARDVMTAAVLGAGPVADAFFVALRLPNLFRRILAEGAFSVAFVPIFAGELHSKGQPAAQQFAQHALSVLMVILLPLTALFMIGMPWVMYVLAPGFADDPVQYELAIHYARLTFPYLMLMSLSALFGAVLNAIDRFAPFAGMPILFNAILIGALILAHRTEIVAGDALALAVPVAGLVQLVFMAWMAARAGMPLYLPVPTFGPQIRHLFKLMAPAAVGAGVMQINLFIDTLLASELPQGAISYLFYASQLYQLPLSVIGIAIGTALLPMLARQVKAAADGGDGAPVQASQNRAIEYSLLLALPAAIGLIVLALPIVATLFERGAFTAANAVSTSWALMAYSIGLPGFIVIKVLQTGFYARHDTATPVRIAVVTTMINAALSVGLILSLPPLWGHVGIATATGVTAWLNVALLARSLRRRGHLTFDDRLRARLPRLVLAGLAMAIVVGVASWAAWGSLTDELLVKASVLAAIIVVGAVVYFGAAHLLGGLDLRDLRTLLRRTGDATGRDA